MGIVEKKPTTTGGRDATTRHIPGDAVLSVCMPPSPSAPEGWKWVALTDVAQLESGHTPSRRHPEYWVGSIPWMGVRDAGKSHGTTIWDTSEHTNELGIINSSARILPKGTVCLSRGGTVGYVVVLGRPMATSQGFANWICGNSLNPEFLKYLLLSEIRALHGFSIGATIRTIYYPDIKALHVCIPSLAEQQRIVGILDEAFEVIAEAKANAKKNLLNARALFESELHFVFAESWQNHAIVNLSDLATDITDGDHQPPPKSQTGVPFITIGNISKATRSIDFSDTFKVPRAYFESLKPNRRPRSGDVLYTVTGSFGIPVIVNGFADFCFQRHIGLIRPKAETSTRWLYYLLLSPQVFRQASDGATGTAQKTVSLNVLRAILVPKVARLDQEKIATRLDAITEQAQHLESIYQRKLDALDALKKSLLHQAFTGQL